MLRKLRKRIKGQSTAEYAILIALVVSAIVAMQTYVKRGINARLKAASDRMESETGLGSDLQYEPYYHRSAQETARDSNIVYTMDNANLGYDQDTKTKRYEDSYTRTEYAPGGTFPEGMQ